MHPIASPSRKVARTLGPRDYCGCFLWTWLWSLRESAAQAANKRRARPTPATIFRCTRGSANADNSFSANYWDLREEFPKPRTGNFQRVQRIEAADHGRM